MNTSGTYQVEGTGNEFTPQDEEKVIATINPENHAHREKEMM